MTVRAMQAGLRIAEVPNLELPRRTSASNLHAIRDGILSCEPYRAVTARVYPDTSARRRDKRENDRPQLCKRR